MASHRRDYKKYLNGKFGFITSFEILKFEDAYIELIEKYSCTCKKELESKEGKYIREMECVNKIQVGRTFEEFKKYRKEYDKKYYEDKKEHRLTYNKKYRKDNKEKLALKKKQYYEANKTKIALKRKQYYEDNKDQYKQYYEDNKDQINLKKKQYRVDNKEQISTYNKQYRKDNKEKINQKITCRCGSTITKHNKKRHERSKKHIQYIELNK